MLYELECDAFATTVDGKQIPRGKIYFKQGLNTIQGDKLAQNSIGKSTFLMIVDFCFGGDDYKKNNAKMKVGNHIIKFAFKDNESRLHYFSRDTLTPTKVNICDSYYSVIDIIGIEKFRDILLHDIYAIELPDVTFRGILGRFMRIYGKGNYDEQHPLTIGRERPRDSILALEKLFDTYRTVKQFKEEKDKTEEQLKSYKSAVKFHYISNAAKVKNDKDLKKNEEQITLFQQNLFQMEEHMDTEMTHADAQVAEKTLEIKEQLTVLRRQRSRLLSQQSAVRINKLGGHVPSQQNIKALSVFFPNLNMKRIEEIEHFHSKMQTILVTEMDEEHTRIQALIDSVDREITRLEEEQRRLGIPVKLPKPFLQQYAKITHDIEDLEAQNQEYLKGQEIAAAARAANEEYTNNQEQQLRRIEAVVHEEMVRINDFIYDGERSAPVLDLKNGNSYKFSTPDDDGTGTNYKGLIVFDLSILRLTVLPAIAHDSLIFKNIGDLPIDKIFQLYQDSQKQIFVVFDKKDAFTQTTQNIIDATTVIELHENGGELFGWSWARNRKK